MALEAAGALDWPAGWRVRLDGSLPKPTWLVASPALAVQLNHHIRAQHSVLLAANPLVQLSRRPFPGRESAGLEGHDHPGSRARWSAAGALAGGGDRPLPTRLGVQGRRAKAAAGEGSAQRPPAVPSAAGGRIEAAEPLGQGEGVFGLCAVSEESAGLPAYRWVEAHPERHWPPASCGRRCGRPRPFPRDRMDDLRNDVPLETVGDRSGSDGMWPKRGPGTTRSPGAVALRVADLAWQGRPPPAAPTSEPARQPPC